MNYQRSLLHRTNGQGLVEYAMLLTLVAAVVIAALTLLGPAISNVFCQVTTGLNGGAGGCAVAISRAEYNSGSQELHLDATADGGYDPAITLTASPGGVMEARSDHYHLKYNLAGCPCTVTVTSSAGASATVTVGP